MSLKSQNKGLGLIRQHASYQTTVYQEFILRPKIHPSRRWPIFLKATDQISYQQKSETMNRKSFIQKTEHQGRDNCSDTNC